MKVKTDISGELEVPTTIEKRFLKWCKEEGCEADEDSFGDYIIEKELAEGGIINLIPKEETEFLVAYKSGYVSIHGGYPREWIISFEDGGFKYTVVAFMWTGDLETEPKTEAPYFVAYKEKVQ